MKLVLVTVIAAWAWIALALHAHGRALSRIELKLVRQYYALKRQGEHMAGELDALEANTAANGSAIDSAVTLLSGLKEKLDEAIASGDMSRVAAVTETLGAKTATLAAAVVANTPAAP